jgi:hypothetical protein
MNQANKVELGALNQKIAVPACAAQLPAVQASGMCSGRRSIILTATVTIKCLADDLKCNGPV